MQSILSIPRAGIGLRILRTHRTCIGLHVNTGTIDIGLHVNTGTIGIGLDHISSVLMASVRMASSVLKNIFLIGLTSVLIGLNLTEVPIGPLQGRLFGDLLRVLGCNLYSSAPQ
ncbi:MAG: hypothetical protein MJY68_00035 [Bacteroidaceae bacterium]|nr:hypothetical protein [Bacteroidaceae bacterium]